jgi:hypothetical protein
MMKIMSFSSVAGFLIFAITSTVFIRKGEAQ